MPAFSTLHNELRMRVPEKPYEFYNDAIRWAINEICIKTALWRVTSTITTVAGKSTYSLDLPVDTVIHSNLYIVQKGNTDRVIKRPVNGFKIYPAGTSDYLQAFKTYSENEIEIFPTPDVGGVTLDVITAIKPTSSAENASNNKFFAEYKDTVVYGGLFRCLEDEDIVRADRAEIKFKNGYSSIHGDVIRENAATPTKVNTGW